MDKKKKEKIILVFDGKMQIKDAREILWNFRKFIEKKTKAKDLDDVKPLLCALDTALETMMRAEGMDP